MRCAVEVAPIRAEPSDDAEQVTQVLLRERLLVEARRDGWARVTTVYDYPGWMRERALEEGQGELPQLIDEQPLSVARMYLGSKYEWGGLSKRGIDCSGLVHVAYRLAGRLVPRDAWQQEEAGAPVAEDEALPGELVTYGAGERADHVAFWLGNGRILHATARAALGVVVEDEPPSCASPGASSSASEDRRRSRPGRSTRSHPSGACRDGPMAPTLEIMELRPVTNRGMPLKKGMQAADTPLVDAAKRDEILTRYREHSQRFQTVAARRAPVAEVIDFPPRQQPELEHFPTAREIEVLQLVSEGLVNREIGDRLYLSEETVKSHVRHLLAKLQARSRAHAVAVGFRRGLLT